MHTERTLNRKRFQVAPIFDLNLHITSLPQAVPSTYVPSGKRVEPYVPAYVGHGILPQVTERRIS
jgi:hypothetical protein